MPSIRATTSVPKRPGGRRPARRASICTACAVAPSPSLEHERAVEARDVGAPPTPHRIGPAWPPAGERRAERRPPRAAPPPAREVTAAQPDRGALAAMSQLPVGVTVRAPAEAVGGGRRARREEDRRAMPDRARPGSRPILNGGLPAVLDQVKSDLTTAMKAGEKERVGALRLVLSELQKDEKEGHGRRAGRAPPRAQAPPRRRRAVPRRRPRRARRQEESEAELIGGYLPAELSDDELRGLVDRGRRRDRRRVAEGHGPGHGRGHAHVGRPRRRQAGPGPWSGRCSVRRQIELTNAVAAELAGSAGRRSCARSRPTSTATSSCAATCSRSTGAEDAVEAGATVVARALRPHRRRPPDRPGDDRRVDRRARAARVARAACSRTSSGATAALKVAPKTVNQKRYVDSIRRNTITFGIGPAGTGKTFLAVALAAAALPRREVNRIILTRPAVEAGERLGFLPGDLMAKVDPYLRPLFDALHDMLDPEQVAQLPRARRRSRSRRSPSCAAAR